MTQNSALVWFDRWNSWIDHYLSKFCPNTLVGHGSNCRVDWSSSPVHYLHQAGSTAPVHYLHQVGSTANSVIRPPRARLHPAGSTIGSVIRPPRARLHQAGSIAIEIGSTVREILLPNSQRHDLVQSLGRSIVRQPSFCLILDRMPSWSSSWCFSKLCGKFLIILFFLYSTSCNDCFSSDRYKVVFNWIDCQNSGSSASCSTCKRL